MEVNVNEQGVFEKVTDDTPQEWPRFTEGETVEVKGVKFVIGRINRTSIVLRPVVNSGQLERDFIRQLISPV